mgnify:CR=1 FL=1
MREELPPADLAALLARMAAALERLAPDGGAAADPAQGDAFAWDGMLLAPATLRAAQPLGLLVGVDAQAARLVEAFGRHAAGLPAHDALLWGARGQGKSALVHAARGAVVAGGADLPLVALGAAALPTLPGLFGRLAGVPRRFLLFVDDLAFDHAGHAEARSLRSLLDGGVSARPDNVRLVVTSNHRHLWADSAGAATDPLAPRDAAEDRLALADRFGLVLGFHAATQAEYLAMVEGYARHHGLPFDPPDALAWAQGRGARSGRVAWQYVEELAGRMRVRLG